MPLVSKQTNKWQQGNDLYIYFHFSLWKLYQNITFFYLWFLRHRVTSSFSYLDYARVYRVFVNLLLKWNPNEKEWSSKNIFQIVTEKEMSCPDPPSSKDLMFSCREYDQKTASICMLLQDLPQLPGVIPFQKEPIFHDGTR